MSLFGVPTELPSSRSEAEMIRFWNRVVIRTYACDARSGSTPLVTFPVPWLRYLPWNNYQAETRLPQ